MGLEGRREKMGRWVVTHECFLKQRDCKACLEHNNQEWRYMYILHNLKMLNKEKLKPEIFPVFCYLMNGVKGKALVKCYFPLNGYYF